MARKVLGDPGPIRPRPDYAAEPSVARPRTPPGPARRPSLTTFRDTVNPLFYQAGEDGHSCAECHGNHTVLRIAPADAARSGEDPLTINYNSALKVIDLDEPENSLILRKPLSPFGQGDPDPSSPTGLTHVGGPRWDASDHPAYRAILDWIRQAPKDEARPGPTTTGRRFRAGNEHSSLDTTNFAEQSKTRVDPYVQAGDESWYWVKTA